MKIITILTIAVAANIDNLGISMAYGLRANRIPIRYNLIISLISMACAFASILIGSFLSGIFSISTSNMIGGILLIGLGLWTIVKAANPPKECVRTMDYINWKEAIVLGFILAFNCLSIGFSAGVTGVEPFSTSLAIGVCSFISIMIGFRIGEKIGSSKLGQQAERLGGLLLIVIGLNEIFI
ncbi:manganese efflux pump MntP [Sporosarcina sp. UB5]|uniref:manganese efflux pump MntP n=1 Tax=Sporosarcina sp. UB5 TaxID=3047463 RepID=UPI003D7B3901